MKPEEALRDIIESVEELAKGHPPRIELKGWWWKKYVPHYRRVQEVLQILVDEEWANNYVKIEKMLSKEWREDFLRRKW